MTDPTDTRLRDLLILSHQVLRLGQVQRATWHPDRSAESDTTHTCMLGVAALALQPYAAVRLDAGKLARLAYVHDYCELYAGDTNTLGGLDADARAAKAEREAQALERVRAELRRLPHLVRLIGQYEAQACDEARWLRYLDKVLPKLTHWWNGCGPVVAHGMTLIGLQQAHRAQGDELRGLYPRYTMLHRLFGQACRASEDAYSRQLRPSAASADGLQQLLAASSPAEWRAQYQQVPPPRREDCTCYRGCEGEGNTWHQHADDPCVVHPDRVVRP
jgi:5'-deoxynucleotidase YfbR-like HD superfamily hydrolase